MVFSVSKTKTKFILKCEGVSMYRLINLRNATHRHHSETYNLVIIIKFCLSLAQINLFIWRIYLLRPLTL